MSHLKAQSKQNYFLFSIRISTWGKCFQTNIRSLLLCLQFERRASTGTVFSSCNFYVQFLWKA